MSYQKTNWSETEPINITNLQKIEDAIENLQPNIMTVSTSVEQTIDSSSNYKYIDLDNIDCSVGTKLTIGEVTTTTSDASVVKGIKIPSGVSKIKVSSNVLFTNNNETSEMRFITYINRITSTGSVIIKSRTTGGNIAASDSTCLSCSSKIISVSEGDIIGLRAYKSLASGTAAIGTGDRTWLTVEVVE